MSLPYVAPWKRAQPKLAWERRRPAGPLSRREPSPALAARSGDNARLLQEAQRFANDPLLHHLSTRDAAYEDPPDSNLPACRGDASKSALVHAPDYEVGGYNVGFGNHAVDGAYRYIERTAT